MEAFTELRRQARERRDKTIVQARDEYAATLARIAALEQDLLGRELSTHKTASACMDQVIPVDRAFTTIDVLAALEALDPKRNWRKRTIDSHIQRMRDRGLVRRLRRSQNTLPAIYARVGVEVEPLPFEGMTLPEVARAVLEERGPMRQTELAVALLEAGYSTTMDAKHLRDALSAVLRKGSFKSEAGKWAARAQ